MRHICGALYATERHAMARLQKRFHRKQEACETWLLVWWVNELEGGHSYSRRVEQAEKCVARFQGGTTRSSMRCQNDMEEPGWRPDVRLLAEWFDGPCAYLQ